MQLIGPCGLFVRAVALCAAKSAYKCESSLLSSHPLTLPPNSHLIRYRMKNNSFDRTRNQFNVLGRIDRAASTRELGLENAKNVDTAAIGVNQNDT